VLGGDGNLNHDGPTSPVLDGQLEHSGRLAWKDGSSTVWDKVQEHIQKAWNFMCSETGIAIFKCALAYLLGSMATFVPALSHLFGRQDSKHLIATITVYFHPARSFGSMLDALSLAVVSFLYTSFVSVVSMSISMLFKDVLHLVVLGHTVILVFFVGGGLGFIGWVKLKRGDPLVNIACSLTSLSLITVLTKEGAVQEGNYSFAKISQILKMIIAGVCCAMLVSFLVFPSSGRLNLKKNMTEVTDALSDILGLITRCFISGDEHELEDHEYVTVHDRYMKSSAKISQNLKEAQYEHCFFGDEKVSQIEAKIAQCLQRIGQSVGGLRSAAAMQFIISKEMPHYINRASIAAPTPWTNSPALRIPPSPVENRQRDSLVNLFNPAVNVSREGTPQAQEISSRRSTVDYFRSNQEIFELFIQQLAPSMRALAYTMKEILDDLPFNPDDNYRVSLNPRFEVSLERALNLYKDARKDALQTVYNKKEMDRSRPMEVEADWEEAAACCGHFSFSLLEVAQQIKEFLHCLDELQIEVEERPSGKSWSWLKFWDRSKHDNPQDYGHQLHSDNHRKTFDLRNPDSREARDRQYWAESRKAHWKQALFRRLNKLLAILRQEDNKFAIKVGIGAMLYALPAYVRSTYDIYAYYRGEWGLLSYMLVCSMTIGASNTTGIQRFLGTGLGAGLAILVWWMSNDSPVALAFFGFFMAYWTAWIILGQGKGPMGRFIMLTYNLTALYSYSLLIADDPGDGDEEDSNSNPLVLSIAFHRVVAVLSGCIWGLIVTRLIWPMSARQKLKDSISLLWLRMCLIWKRDPLSIFTEGEPPNEYMNLREEAELQRFLAKLQGLVESSKHEFDLRRPFPYATYDRILKSIGRMLEAFHAMNLVIMEDLNPSAGEIALLNATVNERRDLCSRLSHQFSILASSIKLECSMASDAVPSTDRARDRLLARIFVYRKDDAQRTESETQIGGEPQVVESMGPKTTDEDYGLLYTYALVTGQLGVEIATCMKEVENLFGVLDEESLMLQ